MNLGNSSLSPGTRHADDDIATGCARACRIFFDQPGCARCPGLCGSNRASLLSMSCGRFWATTDARRAGIQAQRLYAPQTPTCCPSRQWRSLRSSKHKRINRPRPRKTSPRTTMSRSISCRFYSRAASAIILAAFPNLHMTAWMRGSTALRQTSTAWGEMPPTTTR